MNQPQPLSITRFASAARSGIDALALQLVQTEAALPPMLDASSLAPLAVTAESLSLRPFAESLLAVQLAIEAIAAQGLSQEAAAAELVADLVLQLQAATDDLEAGNTLASMSDDLLEQVKELITLADSASSPPADAGQITSNSVPTTDIEPAPSQASAELEPRVVDSVKYQPRFAITPTIDEPTVGTAESQLGEQPALTDDGLVTDSNSDATQGYLASDRADAAAAEADFASQSMPPSGTFDAADTPSITSPIKSPIRYQPRSASAFASTSDDSFASANQPLASDDDQTTPCPAPAASAPSVAAESAAASEDASQAESSIQADPVDSVDQPAQADQPAQVDQANPGSPASITSEFAPADAASSSTAPQTVPWPPLCIITEPAPVADFASADAPTQPPTASVQTPADSTCQPLSADPASESDSAEGATSWSDKAPDSGTHSQQLAQSNNPGSDNPGSDDPWDDGSAPRIGSPQPAAFEANTPMASPTAPVLATSLDNACAASGAESDLAGTEFASTTAEDAHAEGLSTSLQGDPIDSPPEAVPSLIHQPSIHQPSFHQLESSAVVTDDSPLTASLPDAAAAPEFPQAAIALPDDVCVSDIPADPLTEATDFAAPEPVFPEPVSPEPVSPEPAALSAVALHAEVTAPASTDAAGDEPSVVEPIDTGWQQTDEDLTLAAGSMGIDFTADGSSPIPESVDLDAINDRISALLQCSPPLTTGEPQPSEQICDPAEMAVAAKATIAALRTPGDALALESDKDSEPAIQQPAAEFAPPIASKTTAEPQFSAAGEPQSSNISSTPESPDAANAANATNAANAANATSTFDPSADPQCTAIAAEATLDAGGPAELTPEQMAALMAGGDDFDSGMPASEWGSFPISFPPEKIESLQFMVADAKAGIEQLSGAITQLTNFGSRDEAAASITDIAAALDKISVAFNFTSLKIVVGLIHDVARRSAQVSDALMPEVLVRARAIHSLIEQHIRGLECGMEVKWSLDTLVTRTRRLLADKPLHPSVRGWHQGDIYRLLELDLVNESFDSPPRPDSEDQFVDDGSVWIPPVAAADGSGDDSQQGAEAEKKQETEQIIRVAATTIDSMLDLISQLVLTKNRVFNLSRTIRLPGSQEARFEELTTAADELSVLTGNLQMTMMQARMQPITKLFERYNRVVGDLAGLADKKVNLVVGGHAAMIDKNLFDGLAEAMSQLLRSIVTKQVRVPAERAAQSKPEAATISLDAESQGAQIIISIEHDGDLPDPAALAATAVEKNVCDAEALDTLSDNELFLLAFKPDFGDPQLSKVGTLIAELGGKLGIRVTADGLTRVEIALPLSVAIVPAILVGIGSESYAIPLQSVEEIIRCSDFQASTVHGKPVIRLRESLLDVVAATSIIGEPAPRRTSTGAVELTGDQQPPQHSSPSDALASIENADQAMPEAAQRAAASTPHDGAQSGSNTEVKNESNAFGLVLSAGFTRAVLTVDRIIGKQEIVIKKLEGPIANIRCFAGATIRNDGSISLIFDVAELLKAAS